MTETWVAGRVFVRRRWSINGLFETREEAMAHCSVENDFVAPLLLGCFAEHTNEWPGIEFYSKNWITMLKIETNLGYVSGMGASGQFTFALECSDEANSVFTRLTPTSPGYLIWLKRLLCQKGIKWIQPYWNGVALERHEATLQSVYEALVNDHDLTFQYSDDASCWQRGNAELARLRELEASLDPEYVKRTWNAAVDRKLREDSREAYYKK